MKPFSARFERVPAAAVAILIRQLEGLGVEFDLADDRRSGEACSISGRVRFEHSADDTLSITVLENPHFPRRLVAGGMRQLVLEAVELTGV